MTFIKSLLIVIFFIILIGCGMVWTGNDMENTRKERAETHSTYTGGVTAITHHENSTTVYLDSEPQQITIYGGNTELKVGEEYIITIDGNRCLVNAVIVEE